MTNIIRPTETWKKPKDFLQKASNDLLPDDYVPYESAIAEAVDAIAELCKKRGYPKTVRTEEDWQIIEFIAKIFSTLYPQEFADFKSKQLWNKNNQKNVHASNREQGGAQVRHLIEIPMTFYRLINAAFPQQKVQDKKFALEMGRRLPLMRWADKQ
jgi:hypothetical protein